MSEQGTRSKKPIGADLIIPVAASAYAIYYVASVWHFPAEAQKSGIFLAGLLLTLTTLFFIKSASLIARGQARFDFGTIFGPVEGRGRRIAFLVLTVAYVFVVSWGGFTLTTFLFVFLGSLLAGLRPIRKALIFAFVAALSGWLFFIVLLGTRFPRGPFEHLIARVVWLWT